MSVVILPFIPPFTLFYISLACVLVSDTSNRNREIKDREVKEIEK